MFSYAGGALFSAINNAFFGERPREEEPRLPDREGSGENDDEEEEEKEESGSGATI